MMKLLYAQDVTNIHGGEAAAAFNSRIHGYSYAEVFAYPAQRGLEAYAGYQLADDMIRIGKIYSIHCFPHPPCHGAAFLYGGFWVCNSCGNKDVNKDWWAIKCFQDGSAWCCIGPDFEDLQISDNYAFGDTREEAITNYGMVMLLRDAA